MCAGDGLVGGLLLMGDWEVICATQGQKVIYKWAHPTENRPTTALQLNGQLCCIDYIKASVGPMG